MWAVFLMGLMAAFRKRLRMPLRLWQRTHLVLAIVTVIGSVVHAYLIEGTMETLTKIIISLSVLAATAKVIADRVQQKR